MTRIIGITIDNTHDIRHEITRITVIPYLTDNSSYYRYYTNNLQGEYFA